MATLNLGRIKPVFQGAYSGSTAYVVDDIVTFGDETFICIQASTGNATSNASYWTKMAAKGTDGTNVGTTITTQGDILYRDGSGLQRLGAGTSGQYLKTQGTGANPVWGTVSAGTYSVHAVSRYNYATQITQSSGADYVDISNGNYVQFQPTSTNDFIFITHSCAVNCTTSDSGCDAYMMMKEGAATIGSGDTKLNCSGNHSTYISGGSMYSVISKSFLMPCTGLNTSSIYYLEQAGQTHNANTVHFNSTATNHSGSFKIHDVSLIHYKA